MNKVRSIYHNISSKKGFKRGNKEIEYKFYEIWNKLEKDEIYT